MPKNVCVKLTHFYTKLLFSIISVLFNFINIPSSFAATEMVLEYKNPFVLKFAEEIAERIDDVVVATLLIQQSGDMNNTLNQSFNLRFAWDTQIVAEHGFKHSLKPIVNELSSISNLPSVELSSAYFANCSFILLFLAMTFYWVELAFFDKQKQKLQAVPVASSNYTSNVPTSASAMSVFFNKNGNTKLSGFLGNLGKICILSSNISLILLLCIRWKESGHFPLSNLYESLMFLSWSCTSIHLLLLSVFNNKNQNLFMDKLLGAVLAPCALFLNAFATFSLPKEMQQAGPLVPALQSNWLMMHVTVMIVSYAALILGSLLSIAFLIYNYSVNMFKPKIIVRSKQEPNAEFSRSKSRMADQLTTNFNSNSNSLTVSELKSAPLEENMVAQQSRDQKNNNLHQNLKLPENNPNMYKIASNLDYLSYRIIGIGFPFLTIGILSGAVWANEAWGSYWSWDPKETWALLTWLVFAIYLHTRFTKGWEGEKPAIIASFGFIVVWVCYLGVNLLGEGLHSYGFLT